MVLVLLSLKIGLYLSGLAKMYAALKVYIFKKKYLCDSDLEKKNGIFRATDIQYK
jgi:hypothetical protein